MVHAATQVENNMGSEVEVNSCRKDKSRVLGGWSAFMIDYISAYKPQMVFLGLDLEVDEPQVMYMKIKIILANRGTRLTGL